VYKKQTKIKFEANTKQLLDYFDVNPKASMVGQILLRLYGGITEYMTQVRLSLLTKQLNRPESFVIQQLVQLEKDGMIALEMHDNDTALTFLIPREDDKVINRFGGVIDAYQKNKKKQLEALIDYVQDTTNCRQRILTGYFGEATNKDCGQCDYCNKKLVTSIKPSHKEIAQAITEQLQKEPKTGRQLCELLTFDTDLVYACIDLMIQAKLLNINTKNEYYL
jgi:ATP-dependent DNA helicase RecQ